MIDVLTSWTSWTTSHNAPRGRRQTLFVDVDYSRKATSHKGVTRQASALASHCSNGRVAAMDPRPDQRAVRWAVSAVMRADASPVGDPTRELEDWWPAKALASEPGHITPWSG